MKQLRIRKHHTIQGCGKGVKIFLGWGRGQVRHGQKILLAKLRSNLNKSDETVKSQKHHTTRVGLRFFWGWGRKQVPQIYSHF